jgi:hypothetical protein
VGLVAASGDAKQRQCWLGMSGDGKGREQGAIGFNLGRPGNTSSGGAGWVAASSGAEWQRRVGTSASGGVGQE